MLFLHDYIAQFLNQTGQRHELAGLLQQTKSAYDIFVEGGDPVMAFEIFVERYNWLGINKPAYSISQNESRNLVGALMQDYLLHLVIKLCEPYPTLDIFTEVPVSFGRYPLWHSGMVEFSNPSERSDLAVGYLIDADGNVCPGRTPLA
jgi:hypothetical protein